MIPALELQQELVKRRSELSRYRSKYETFKPVRMIGTFEEVYKSCLQELGRNPWNYGAIKFLGQLSLQKGEYDLSICALEDLSNATPKPDQEIIKDLGLAYYQKGILLRSEKDHQASERSLSNAQNILTKYCGKDQRINEILKTIQVEIVEEKYAQGGGLGRLEKEAGQSTALDKKEQGRVDVGELENKLRNPEENQNNRLEAARQIAAYHETHRDYDSAIKYLQEAMPLDTTITTKKSIANIKRKKIKENPAEDKNEQLTKLKREYEELEREQPKDPEISMALGLVNFDLEQWEDCIKAVQKNPQAKDEPKDLVETLIGQSLLKMKQPIAAEHQFKAIAQRTKDHRQSTYIIATYYLGKAQEAQGKTEEAIESLSEVIRHNIGYEDALETLKRLTKDK